MLRFLGAAILLLHMAASASAATVASAYVQVSVRASVDGLLVGSGGGGTLGRDVVRSGDAVTVNDHDFVSGFDGIVMYAGTLAGAESPNSAALTWATAQGGYHWDNKNWQAYYVDTWLPPPDTTLTLEIEYDVLAEAISDSAPDEYAEAVVEFSLLTSSGSAIFSETNLASISERVVVGDPAFRQHASIRQTMRIQPTIDFQGFQLSWFEVNMFASIYSASAIVAPVPLPGTWPLVAAATGALVLTGGLQRVSRVRVAARD